MKAVNTKRRNAKRVLVSIEKSKLDLDEIGPLPRGKPKPIYVTEKPPGLDKHPDTDEEVIKKHTSRRRRGGDEDKKKASAKK